MAEPAPAPATSSTPVGPVASGERIDALDTIRGVALFGILLMNITAFGLPNAYDDPSNFGGFEGPSLWAWITTTLFFEGTMRSLFSVLFGAGVILLTSRMESRGAGILTADIYYRRNLWLILFGFVHGYILLWYGDILWMYGIVALFLFPLRLLKPKHLIALGVGALVVSTAWSVVDYYLQKELHAQYLEAQVFVEQEGELSEEQQAALDGWGSQLEKYKPDATTNQKVIDAYRGSYWDLLLYNGKALAFWHTWGMYRYSFLDVFALMVIGMALMKIGFLTLQQSNATYCLVIVIGYAVGLLVNAYEVRLLIDSRFDFLVFQKYWITYNAGRVTMAAGHLGVLLLLCRSGWFAGLMRALAAVGRMALTNYVSHTVFCVLFFSGLGLSRFGRLPRHQLYLVVLAIWIFQLVASPMWLRYFRFGPLEWLWRSLTYVKKQPMKQRA